MAILTLLRNYQCFLKSFLIKVILWLILRYLYRISLWEEYPLMLINMSTWFIDYNMVKVVQGEVSKRPGNVFYS